MNCNDILEEWGVGVVNDNKLKALLSLKAQISDDQALSLSLSVVVFVFVVDFSYLLLLLISQLEPWCQSQPNLTNRKIHCNLCQHLREKHINLLVHYVDMQHNHFDMHFIHTLRQFHDCHSIMNHLNFDFFRSFGYFLQRKKMTVRNTRDSIFYTSAGSLKTYKSGYCVKQGGKVRNSFFFDVSTTANYL